MRSISFFAFVFFATANAAPKSTKLTRTELMKGLKIPEKRAFPESTKVKPCEDFHRYVCEETEKSFKLPADRSGWGFAFHDNSERLLHAKKAFFRKISQGFSPEGPRIGQVKNFYVACMNPAASAREEREIVAREKALLTALKSNAEVQDLAQSRMDRAEPSIVSFETLPDQDDPNVLDVLILGQVMSLPERSYYENPEALKDLEALATAFFKEIKVDRPGERAKWLVEFEKGMAQVWPMPAEIRERIGKNTYRPREDLLAAYPALKFGRFFEKVPPKTRIRDLAPEALRYIDQQLESAPLATLQSVYLFHSLHERMDDAYPTYFKKRFDFERKHFGGPAKRPARDERCTKRAMSSFSFEIDEYLMPILFPAFPREKVEELVGRVRKVIVEDIDDSDWLSRSARREAKRKIETARLFLVAPRTEKEWDFNPMLDYAKDKPYANMDRLKQAKIDKEIAELKIPRPRERWGMAPLVLNAYYNPADNLFVLLQGILQPPFFAPQASDAENFGSIGTVVGHELGHAIDDDASRYDADGKLRAWMSEKDLKRFRERGAGFIKRFEAIGHNGQLTLGENIGDSVGLRASYQAAFPKDPGVEPKKEFFKAYARTWCDVTRPEFEKMLLKTDSHALGRARINEQVVHHEAFYEAFQCKDGDKMFVAPTERIRVW